jgi:hypothetical protein
LALTTKNKPAEMSAEVRTMIEVRHQAEQRGNFEPLGRLASMETAHGKIDFPSERGEGVGPDLAFLLRQMPIGDVASPSPNVSENTLLVLGVWVGLPAIRHNSKTACAKCRNTCDICQGEGKKQCEGMLCGGAGWIPGNWIDCPGPGCRKDTGQYKGDCATCAHSQSRGQIREKVQCPMCKGTKLMTCSRCKGSGKFSTGKINGSLDWLLPSCKACGGTGFKGTWVKQDVEKFANAELQQNPPERPFRDERRKKFLALGPVYSFTIRDYINTRMRVFDVTPDREGDYLMLLVPINPRQKPQKAYLIGGIVQERAAQRGEVA